jgi:hypothetical protein
MPSGGNMGEKGGKTEGGSQKTEYKARRQNEKTYLWLHHAVNVSI